MEPQQLNLFAEIPQQLPTKLSLEMNKENLICWKNQIFNYQQQVRETAPPQQTALFDIVPSHCDPNKIEPFSLKLFPLSFFDFNDGYAGDACIYFVLDNASCLILYIGETKTSNLRWSGKHDCKNYVANYIDLNRKYELEIAVNIAFWWDAPVKTKPRQQLESELIYRWQSPFNKQMWSKWGQPFGK